MNLRPDDDRNVADLLVHARQVLRTLDDGLTHDGAGQTINWLVEMLEAVEAVPREYSVAYPNGSRTMLRDLADAERMAKLTTRGRVEWRTEWQPLNIEARPS